MILTGYASIVVPILILLFIVLFFGFVNGM